MEPTLVKKFSRRALELEKLIKSCKSSDEDNGSMELDQLVSTKKNTSHMDNWTANKGQLGYVKGQRMQHPQRKKVILHHS